MDLVPHSKYALHHPLCGHSHGASLGEAHKVDVVIFGLVGRMFEIFGDSLVHIYHIEGRLAHHKVGMYVLAVHSIALIIRENHSIAQIA